MRNVWESFVRTVWAALPGPVSDHVWHGVQIDYILSVLAIFFTALATTLPARAGDTSASWILAPSRALHELSTHTPARPGDRTLVDSLYPFSLTLADTGDIRAAAKAAREGAESTRNMRARLGRAAYVEGGASKGLPPDPGAWGIAALIEGFCTGWEDGV